MNNRNLRNVTVGWECFISSITTFLVHVTWGNIQTTRIRIYLARNYEWMRQHWISKLAWGGDIKDSFNLCNEHWVIFVYHPGCVHSLTFTCNTRRFECCFQFLRYMNVTFLKLLHMIPNRYTSHRVYFYLTLLYMFRALLSPIVSSTKQL
jgi:hypothetical protein